MLLTSYREELVSISLCSDKSFSILLNKLEKEGKINNFRRTNNNSIALDIEKEEVQQLLDLEKTCGFKYKIIYGKF